VRDLRIGAAGPFGGPRPDRMVSFQGARQDRLPVLRALTFVIGRLFGLHLPRAVTIKDVIIIGCVAGIGFTVALFFCTASFPDGDLLDQTKMGALFSFMAVLVAAVMARVLRVGRFAS
jgi:Na+/H+ antiporter NhaA